jgi:hypothetical protein
VEYRSDILFDLIEKGKLGGARWKARLLEDVFHHAGEARNPCRKVDNGESENNDTVSGCQRQAFQLGLDSLSIQCRVVRLVLGDSGKKAREWFAQISRPGLPRVSCEDPLIYDVQVYFDIPQATWK